MTRVQGAGCKTVGRRCGKPVDIGYSAYRQNNLICARRTAISRLLRAVQIGGTARSVQTTHREQTR
jgi:hypothetical protein